MSDEARLSELLLRWEERRESGQTPTALDLCRDCPELLAELGRRVQALAEMDRFLHEDDASLVGAGGTPRGTETLNWPAPIGSWVPGYENLGEVGRGGMGIVYHARDQRLKREVALKMILGSEGSEEALARFLTEARSVARLDHPNIVRVLTSGEYQGQPYFVMEYVKGGSLASKLQGQPMPPHDVARMAWQLAQGLQHAHERGVLHRDLKPPNVLLSEDGTPRITDFGLAQQLDGQDNLTATGAILGTPSYMAPEQAIGDSQRIGPPTDVWAVGVILYELLTGRTPFRGHTPYGTLEQVRTQAPRPPSRLNAQTPRTLEVICLRCLAKEPEARYPTAKALADDLQRFLDGQPVSVPPPPRRRQVPWWAAAVVLGAVVGGLAGALWPSGPAGGPPGTNGAANLRLPLKGFVDVEIRDQRDPRRLKLRLGDNLALPLKEGDEVFVLAELNRPAYLYVLWIDALGEVSPVYPWREGDWQKRPGEEQPVPTLRLPEGPDGYPMKKAATGMETLVLLARESPLPPEVDLRAELNGLSRQEEKNVRAAVWFENGQVVTDDPKRAPDLSVVQRRDHPLFRVQERLRQLQQKHGFSYSRAVSFANVGE